MKKTIFSAALLAVASILVAIGVAEISFPESFLTFTDQEWLMEIWPKAYRYNIHVGLAAIIIATGICVPAYRLQKDFAIRALETLFLCKRLQDSGPASVRRSRGPVPVLPCSAPGKPEQLLCARLSAV